ncbi:MAG: phosphoribosylamine--glycine ligase [Rikenellaceae bacterium]|nr:phosphoribosylamine--glycine ligase [Rikenellaceae bacterium]MCL2693368.1 phosphoribosylamine--glycine ligase [Rikenellaceae bacterium]
MKLPQSVNVLLLGGGGREHALAWRMAQSKRLAKLFIAPGNAGTASVGTNVDLQPTNFASVKQFILNNNINLVVCGPEEPLVKGLFDYIRNDEQVRHTAVIGPLADAARLEGSKAFAKAFMGRHAIPTARYRSFTVNSLQEAAAFIDSLRAPYVLKADGLAAGKGVVIAPTACEAKAELRAMFDGRFGAAGATVVIEEFLHGVECSVFVATDGRNYKILPVAKDYKRVGAGDTGPNTGGMGAVSPVGFADEAFMAKVRRRIIEPTVRGIAEEGMIYHGFIFIGLMNVGGDPYVIEYNVRLGDPETEAVVPLIESDIIGMFEGMAFGTLDNYELRISPRTAVTVVCAAGGYPNEYRKGDVISIPDDAEYPDVIVFHAGTRSEAGRAVTNGGRVLAVTALGETLDQAITRSYEAVGSVGFADMYYRCDIGQDLVEMEVEA